MNNIKLTSAHFTILSIIAIVLALVVTAAGLLADPILLKAPEEAGQQVEKLLSAVSRDDYAAVSSCLAGHPSLGMDREPANAASKLVWESFTASFRYTLEGDFYASSDGLSQDVTVEFLDVSGITDGLNERAQILLAQRVQEAEFTWEIYDDNNEYREDVVMEVLAQAIEESQAQNRKTISVPLTLNLVYQDDQWLIVADNALLSVLSGNTL